MIWLNLATLSLFSCDLISITGTAEYLLQQARYCFSVGMVLFLYAEALVPVIIGYFFYFLICKILYFLIHPAHALKISVMKITKVPSFSCRTSVSIYCAPFARQVQSREGILRCSRLNPLCKIVPVLPLRGVSAVFMYFSSATTVTFSDAVYLYFPKDTQVIFTVPGVFAVKIPLDEITAILGSDVLYIVVFPLSSVSAAAYF